VTFQFQGKQDTFRIVQAYNLASDDKRPTKEESEKATETMKQIEKDKGLKGFFSK